MNFVVIAVLGMHLLGGFYHPDSEPDTCAENARSASWQEFGRNNGTVWGQLVGDAHSDIRKEGAEIRYGYDVPDMIRKGLVPRRNFEVDQLLQCSCLQLQRLTLLFV
jgi:hypothetical protein